MKNFFVTASGKLKMLHIVATPVRNINALQRLHSMPFTRKPWMIKYDTWQVFWLSVHFTFPFLYTVVWEKLPIFFLRFEVDQGRFTATGIVTELHRASLLIPKIGNQIRANVGRNTAKDKIFYCTCSIKTDWLTLPSTGKMLNLEPPVISIYVLQYELATVNQFVYFKGSFTQRNNGAKK